MDELRTKHILYLIDELKVKGGTEKHLYELATGMADAGFRVTVFSLADGIYADEFKGDQRIHYACLNVTRIYDRKGLSAIAEIAGYVCSQQVDIIQSLHTASDLIAPLAARLSFRRPKVLSSRRDLGYTKSSRHIKVQRFVNPLVHGVLANSQAVKDAVINQEGVASEKITVIHNGIHADRFASPNLLSKMESRARYGVPEGALVIGSVGNLRPVKGFRYLVEAAALLCSDKVNLFFMVAGEGEIKGELEELCVSCGIADRFRFIGAVKEIPEFLSLLDIYVQPSLGEGFSNAILEAMAAGVPVIATNVGGNGEVIEDGINGFLVDARDPASLAAAMTGLMGDLCGAKMGAMGRKKIFQEYDISVMLNKYEQYYTLQTM